MSPDSHGGVIPTVDKQTLPKFEVRVKLNIHTMIVPVETIDLFESGNRRFWRDFTHMECRTQK